MASGEAAGGQWPRDTWAEAVFCSDELTTAQRMVALVVADHARDQDVAWVAPERLQQRSGLGRTAANAALRSLVTDGWLQVSVPARQRYSARYRLVVPESQGVASRPSQGAEGVASRPSTPAGRSPRDASGSPRDASGSPRDASGSPRDPDRSSLPEDHTSNTAVVVPVMVVPEDREPSSPAALADRLRGHGVRWSDSDVKTARVRLVALLGDDARAEGLASAVLQAWATRTPRPVEHLLGYLGSMTDEQLIGERAVVRTLTQAGLAKASKPRTVRPDWCGHCDQTSRQLEDDDGKPTRCHRCHPMRAAAAA